MTESSLTKPIVISKETVQRLAKDVKDIMKSPLDDNGIYYIHDEEYILSGSAIIRGPADTPYQYGFYLFTFKFPENYPHAPPVVTYHTNDGETRMNPNLYKSGKVCLSILNTWQGDQWTGCQTIRSILLSICACVFTKKPLLNEPGVRECHPDFKNYTKIITYKNYEIAILDMLNRAIVLQNFPQFTLLIKSLFIRDFDKIMKNMSDASRENDNSMCLTGIYRMKCLINYEMVRAKLTKLYETYKTDM